MDPETFARGNGLLNKQASENEQYADASEIESDSLYMETERITGYSATPTPREKPDVVGYQNQTLLPIVDRIDS
jgi:hypothetical protein